MQRLRRHAGVDLVRHPDAHLDPLVLLDLGAAGEQIVPGRRPVRHLDLLPERAAVVAGVGRVAVAETEVDIGRRVERVALRHRQLLAVPVVELLDDVGHVEHALLVLGQRGDVLDDVVPLTGCDLGGDGRRDVGGVDVVDLGGDAVGLTPLRHELVEPDIVQRHEVAPEEDAEAGAGDVGGRRRLPQRSGARAGPEEGGRRGERERRAGAFEDRSPIGPSGQKGSQPIVSHRVAPLRLRASRRGLAGLRRPVRGSNHLRSNVSSAHDPGQRR